MLTLMIVAMGYEGGHMLTLMIVAMLADPPGGSPIEPAYRAGKALQIAQADTGMSLAKFTEKVDAFTLEVQISADKAATPDRPAVAAYQSALEAYADARQLWQDREEFRRLIGGEAPCAGKCEERFVKRYAITGLEKRAEGGARSPSYRSAEVLRELLAIASSRLDEAHRAYLTAGKAK